MTVKTTSPPHEVASGIYHVPLPMPMRPSIVNVWLIDGGNEWALADTGMRTEESLAALRNALATLDLSPIAIGKIICTHHHPDHFGASAPLRDLCRAEVFLHGLDAERLRIFLPHPRSTEAEAFFKLNGIPPQSFANVPTPGEFWRDMYAPATPDHLINDGDELQIGDRDLQVVWTPGHTPGHCCFYCPRTKALIAGDHLLPRISPHVGVYPSGPLNPLADYLASLEKVAQLDVELVLPSHGGAFRDHRHRAAQLIHHHEYRMLAALDAIRAKPRTSYAIAKEIFHFTEKAPVQVQLPATFETPAHLELLARQGRVTKIEEGDLLRFRAV